MLNTMGKNDDYDYRETILQYIHALQMQLAGTLVVLRAYNDQHKEKI